MLRKPVPSNVESVSPTVFAFVLFQLYSLIGFMFTEDSSSAFALFKFVQVRTKMVKNEHVVFFFKYL